MIIFQPPIRLKNPHLQTILASNKLRLLGLPKKPAFKKVSHRTLVESKWATLSAHVSKQTSHDVVLLIHGWEGSAESTYIQRMAHALFEAGCTVVRVNMRDHGDSHDLNEALFHSCRINEMVAVLDWLASEFPDQDLSVCGFSLGGNFALRMASQSEVKLKKVLAISPPVNPQNTMNQIKDSPLYSRYFLKKWRRSLLIKADLFPHLFEGNEWQTVDSIAELTSDFVKKYTEYPDAQSYFAGYQITEAVIINIQANTQIISSWDDPVIPFEDLSKIDRLPQANILSTPWGGHCGFIQGFSVRSWLEEHVIKEICHESN